MRRKWYLIVPAAIAGIILFTFLGGSAVQWLWNGLTPQLFGWKTITFWQALGLLALCRILFGGFGMHRRGPRMHDRMQARMNVMTSEERAAFRAKMRKRFGLGADDETAGAE